MASITIAKKHALSHKKAREIAEKIAKDLQRRFELAYAWEGDHVDFERPGVSGRMLGRARSRSGSTCTWASSSPRSSRPSSARSTRSSTS